MDKILQGEIEEEQAQTKDDMSNGVPSTQPKLLDVGVEPPTPSFIIDMPNISAIDMSVVFQFLFFFRAVLNCSIRDIMKLTALFTARRGRNFLATLSAVPHDVRRC